MGRLEALKIQALKGCVPKTYFFMGRLEVLKIQALKGYVPKIPSFLNIIRKKINIINLYLYINLKYKIFLYIDK